MSKSFMNWKFISGEWFKNWTNLILYHFQIPDVSLAYEKLMGTLNKNPGFGLLNEISRVQSTGPFSKILSFAV